MQEHNSNDNTTVGESATVDESNNKKGKQKDNKQPAVTDTEASVKTANTSPSTSKQAYMYLGPNIPGGRLFGGSIIRGGLPKDLPHLQDVLEKLPELEGLFVEVAKVPSFKVEVATQGTEAHRLFTVVAKKINEGVLKHGV